MQVLFDDLNERCKRRVLAILCRLQAANMQDSERVGAVERNGGAALVTSG